MKDSRERTEALEWLHDSLATQEVSAAIASYVDAASVLSSFEPDKLQSSGDPGPMPREDALFALLDRCGPAGPTRLGRWQLKDSVRRIALQRLGSRDMMLKARAANPWPATDPIQTGIDLLLHNHSPPLTNLTLEELLGVERATMWLSGILADLPTMTGVVARIEHERLFAPLRKIAGENFVDREKYRQQLADYVGVLPPKSSSRLIRRRITNVGYRLEERPSLHIHGPGGMGKSALLARFILDHADTQCAQPVPFVYLDFDRGTLDPRSPDTLLDEAIRQLLIQFSWVSEDLLSLGNEGLENSARYDPLETSKSRHFDSSKNLMTRFCRLVRVIAERNDQSVLIVLDTLEEAEYQGESAMIVTWELLRELLQRVESLRVVTAGRSELRPTFPHVSVELVDLPEEAAMQFLLHRTAKLPGGPVSEESARQIIALVGRVPFSLALAARVMLNEGLDSLQSVVGQRSLFSKIKTEQQQGMLYRRILGHVRLHDPELEKVANPGLVLRRITPEIIEKVLASPCRLKLRGPQHAQALFEELSREVGLVDPNREPGALWHLPAVRRIMLPELRGTLGAVTKQIHELAALYYRGRPGLIDKGEEIYHQLWLEADPHELDQLWDSGGRLDSYLRGAFEELEAPQKIWLGDKLGIELDSTLRTQAEYAIWERQAERRARTLMARGLLTAAMAALKERPRSDRPSPLYGLEFDILKLLGRFEEANDILSDGLAVAKMAGDLSATLPLVLREVFLSETRGEFERAFGRAMEAASLADNLDEPLEKLSAQAAVLRVGRKLTVLSEDRKGGVDEISPALLARDPPLRDSSPFLNYKNIIGDSLGASREEMLKSLKDLEIRSALRGRPALLTEVAAELGSENIDLLVEAVTLLGTSTADFIALRDHVKTSESKLDNRQRLLFSRLLNSPSSRGMGRGIAFLVPVFPDFFARRLAQSVENSLHQTINVQIQDKHSVATGKSVAVDKSDLQELARVSAHTFTQEELQLLALDIFDLNLGHISPPQESLKLQFFRLLEYSAQQGMLDRLVTQLGRSRPNNESLQQLARHISDQAKTSGEI